MGERERFVAGGRVLAAATEAAGGFDPGELAFHRLLIYQRPTARVCQEQQ